MAYQRGTVNAQEEFFPNELGKVIEMPRSAPQEPCPIRARCKVLKFRPVE
jgi:hypothetical protein